MVEFLDSESERPGGVRIEVPGGLIHLPDGSASKLLYVWDEQGLARRVSYDVESPSGEVLISNLYRIRHNSGLVTEDGWTGNAGMVVTKKSKKKRLYRCSDGMGEFNPNDHVFTVGWREQMAAKSARKR
ncbi:MAG: hypothetical protein KDB82_09330 [Planctomycetes bacterium]|nr:hypothetical protein [Planctomycetota bacterium]